MLADVPAVLGSLDIVFGEVDMMSLKKIHDVQPVEFKFSNENLNKAQEILKKYPVKNKKSAVMSSGI